MRKLIFPSTTFLFSRPTDRLCMSESRLHDDSMMISRLTREIGLRERRHERTRVAESKRDFLWKYFRSDERGDINNFAFHVFSFLPLTFLILSNLRAASLMFIVFAQTVSFSFSDLKAKFTNHCPLKAFLQKIFALLKLQILTRAKAFRDWRVWLLVSIDDVWMFKGYLVRWRWEFARNVRMRLDE